jgi:drug/metabolite transporter (DMT)-like permease
MANANSQSRINSEQNTIKGIALGLFTVFIGSILSVVVKLIASEVNIFTVVFFQFGICLICLLPWLMSNGRNELKTDQPITHLIRGIFGCLSFYAFYFSINHISLAEASLLRHSAPLIVPLILFIFYQTKIPVLRWVALLLGFIGIIMILRPTEGQASFWHLIGLCSGIGLAFSMVLTRKLSKNEPEKRILFYYFIISLLASTPFFIANFEPIPMQTLPWLLLIGFGMYFAFIPYTRAYAYAKSSIVSATSYFAVIYAGLFDWLLWDILPKQHTIAGTLIILLAGFIIVRQSMSEEKLTLESIQ